jgi:hypothetical protein
MNRYIIGSSLAAVLAMAPVAFAGPNGAGTFFPPGTYRHVSERNAPPHALLGDTSTEADSGRALRPGMTGKQPTRAWARRPSEGK